MTVVRVVDTPTKAQYVKCRTLGHAWDELPPNFDVRAPVWRFKLLLRCERCGMVRKEAVDAYGDVVYRKYDAPEGYSYAEDDTPTRAEFRLLMLAEKKRKPERRAG